MKQCFIFMSLVSMLFFSGCTKDGLDGSNGIDGKQGEQGVAGVDGTALLNGNGAPNNSLGKNGDFYLDKTTVSIYGPKTAAGWGEATSLKGKDGEDGKDGKDGTNGTDGKDGSKILSGNQIPTMQDGAIGDFYFDTQNIAIYGPKTSSSWGTPVSLKTPTGKEVTVLLYKNHSFQTINWDEDNDEFNMKSVILIDSKYQEVYDNGIILAQIRESNNVSSYWDNQGTYLLGDRIWAHIRPEYDAFLTKETLTVLGSAYDNITEPEIKAAKIDIKIVFIPASNVIEMQAKSVNTKDFKAVAKYLNL